MRLNLAARPTNVKDMVVALIGEITPDAPDEAIDNALECRDQLNETQGATSALSNPDNLDNIETGLHLDDTMFAKKAAE
eukprot:5526040-Pyramimonas_sp.AAC.1